jgi:hypothetical protein
MGWAGIVACMGGKNGGRKLNKRGERIGSKERFSWDDVGWTNVVQDRVGSLAVTGA